MFSHRDWCVKQSSGIKSHISPSAALSRRTRLRAVLGWRVKPAYGGRKGSIDVCVRFCESYIKRWWFDPPAIRWITTSGRNSGSSLNSNALPGQHVAHGVDNAPDAFNMGFATDEQSCMNSALLDDFTHAPRLNRIILGRIRDHSINVPITVWPIVAPGPAPEKPDLQRPYFTLQF